jgi:hypothetical protein
MYSDALWHVYVIEILSLNFQMKDNCKCTFCGREFNLICHWAETYSSYAVEMYHQWKGFQFKYDFFNHIIVDTNDKSKICPTCHHRHTLLQHHMKHKVLSMSEKEASRIELPANTIFSLFHCVMYRLPLYVNIIFANKANTLNIALSIIVFHYGLCH